jgi:hypothetical protein
MRTLAEKLAVLEGIKLNPETKCTCTKSVCKKCKIDLGLSSVSKILDKVISDIGQDD